MTTENMRITLRMYGKLKVVTTLSYTLKKYQDLLGRLMEGEKDIKMDLFQKDVCEVADKLIDELSELKK